MSLPSAGTPGAISNGSGDSDGHWGRANGMQSLVALAQAAYFLITGLWPIFGMRSFEAVTGSKGNGYWLSKSVGMLVIVVGAVLVMAAIRRRITLEIFVLAVGSAFGFIIIDLVYFAQRVVGVAYLVDAIAQMFLIAMWVAVWLLPQLPSRGSHSSPTSKTTTGSTP